MEQVICLKFKRTNGTFCEVFRSADGEECLVAINVSGINLNKVKVNFQWKECVNLFIRVKIYHMRDDRNMISYQNMIIVNNDKHALISTSLVLSQYNNVLLINIAELKNIKTGAYSLTSLISQQSTQNKPLQMEPVVGKELRQLSKDMKNLLRTGYLSDFILSDGTNEIRAHKLILGARSPVFAKMFEHEMKENLENVITINDISADVLKKLLDFIYTGSVEIPDMHMAMNLYIAGDKYAITDLKELCSKILMDVDLDDVLQVIILADLYRDESLKKSVLSFISKNYSQVKNLEAWGDFIKNHQALTIEVLSSVLDSNGVARSNTKQQ